MAIHCLQCNDVSKRLKECREVPDFEELCESSAVAVLARLQGAVAAHCMQLSVASKCPGGWQQHVKYFEELCESTYVETLCELAALAVVYRLQAAQAFHWLKLSDTKVQRHCNCC